MRFMYDCGCNQGTRGAFTIEGMAGAIRVGLLRANGNAPAGADARIKRSAGRNEKIYHPGHSARGEGVFLLRK